MTDVSPQDARIKQMGEEVLDGLEAKISTMRPAYDEARDTAGDLPPKVQALVDAVLRYDGSMGPHGAIWYLAKAHTLALELVGPKTTIEEFEALVKRRDDLLATIKANAAGNTNAADELEGLLGASGRPLQ